MAILKKVQQKGSVVNFKVCNMSIDISSRQDIEVLVNAFYDKVKEDPTIGYLFNDVANVNWEKHLPRMYDFWESILFDPAVYKGNPMPVHQHLHSLSPLLPVHFQQWKSLFLETVDLYFKGDVAELAKQRAVSIATVMQIKILHPDSISDK